MICLVPSRELLTYQLDLRYGQKELRDLKLRSFVIIVDVFAACGYFTNEIHQRQHTITCSKTYWTIDEVLTVSAGTVGVLINFLMLNQPRFCPFGIFVLIIQAFVLQGTEAAV